MDNRIKLCIFVSLKKSLLINKKNRMNTELIKIPSYNKILEAVREFYGDNGIERLVFMNYQEVIYALWEFEKINIKASTFTKPIVCRTRKGKHNKSIVFIFIESMDIDAFAATNAERADLIENCITYKASPDKAFSFNQFTKEFKIIKND